jgi:hypothetical protein
MHAWKSMEFISRAEKISLSFAALTRSIYFSTLRINFIYFFAVRYPCFLANQIASLVIRFFTIRTAQPDRCGLLKVNEKITLSTAV